MYAIIQTGGKQYRVAQGDLIKVERLPGEVGETISFDDVKFVGAEDDTQVDEASLAAAVVQGTIVEQGKGDKVLVFRFKKRKMYRRLNGHRQLETSVRIEEISTGASQPKKSTKAAAKPSKKAAAAPKPKEEGTAGTEDKEDKED